MILKSLSTNRARTAGIAALFAAVMFSGAARADAQVEAAGKNVAAAAADVVATLNAMTNAQTAKGLQERLREAFKRQNAAEAAFQAAFAKANPKTDADGKALEKVMGEHAKATAAVSEAMLKATERPGVGGEVGTALTAANPPKDAPKTAKK